MNKVPEDANNENKNDDDDDSIDITQLTGDWGRWQFFLMAILVHINIPAAWYNLGIVFMAPNVDYWCAEPLEYSNATTEEWKNSSIFLKMENIKRNHSKCEMFNNSTENNNTQIPCTSWNYDHSTYKYSIQEKWDLICEKSWLPSLTQSLYYFGYLLTAFFGGQLSDKFGRKPMFYFFVAWTALFGLICTFAPNFWLFAICRFFLGLGRASTFLILYVFILEIVGREQRLIVGSLNKFAWGFGQMVISGLVWTFRDWFYLDLISALLFTIVLPLWWFTPESPRWLLSQERIEEAEKIIRKASAINKIKVENFNEKLKILSKKIAEENRRKQNKKASFLDIMKSPNLRRISLILYFVWISIVLSYYGLSFSADDIGVDMLLFFFLSSLVEIPAGFCYIFLQRLIGRRYGQIASMTVTGVVCLSAIAIPKNLPSLLMAFAVISKFSLSVSFASIYLLSSEVYPTVVRNVGLGSCSMMGRIGAIVAPFMKETAEHVHPAFPLALFGITSLVGAGLVLFLPETKDMNLTDTLTQGEILGSRKLQRSKKKTGCI